MSELKEMPCQSYSEISHDVYMDFAATMRHVVLANPTCQECGDRPSTQINRWGPIKAMCNQCLNAEQARFDAHCAEQEEADRLYGWE